ncbi:hypothetical protein HZ326_25026 [Fusarium oxysporum f. sp. albedinis]|nr:hypothetical protein HZ326_25026 [Fusarium oxysporum f. sp. albedinis]
MDGIPTDSGLLVGTKNKFLVKNGPMETLSHENGVQIAKVAWLSRKVGPKTYGSMVEHYFLVVGESTHTSVFEQITGPEQCYYCQGLGHEAFSCSKNRVCARCAAESHHHSECQALIPKCNKQIPRPRFWF